MRVTKLPRSTGATHMTIKWKAVLDLTQTIAVTIAASAVAFVVISDRLNSTTATHRQAGVAGTADISTEHVSVELTQSATLGDSRARVAVVEFSDFECPYCAVFARNTFPRLRAQLIDSGRI